MERNDEKRSEQAQDEQQPGDLSSFNKKDVDRSTEAEGAVKEEKDASESYLDYNGNSTENAPARSRKKAEDE